MKRINFGSTTLWNTLLLVSVVFAVFILPVLPAIWQRTLFRLVYSVIYISAILSLEKRSRYLIILFISTFVTEWISGILNLEILLGIAKFVNILFFLVIVFSLIHQIATARNVSPGVILDSVAGYLLLGLIFSIFVLFIMQRDPAAYSTNLMPDKESEEYINTSVPLYFSFVSLASLGYGDIVPLKPYTRSLATLIVVTGQFYIAIIVALLVGKFSAQKFNSGDD
jgi:voltage-gated potassium channel